MPLPKQRNANVKDEKYRNLIFGGCYDKLFSGHISIYTTFIFFIITYTDQIKYKYIYLCSILLMSLISLMSKSHYTVDIVTAIIIQYLNFHKENPEETFVYPAHDYKGRFSSTIGDEKKTNPRLGGGKTKEEFTEIMDNLGLSYPKMIDVAVPANMRCGVPDVQ